MNQEYQFENLVLEGGGMRCVAYLGAIKVFEEKGILKNIKRVAGASAGAIIGALLSVGFDYKELRESLLEVDFKDIKDKSHFFFVNLICLYKNFGWFKGDTFEKWFKILLSKKVKQDITFSELHKMKGKNKTKDLYIVGSDLNTRKEIVFSHETYPDMPIATAVRISMSIPLMFSAVLYKGQLLVDGGLYSNYPINVFDKKKYLSANKKSKKKKELPVYNDKTIGLRIENKQEILFHMGQEIQVSKIKSLPEFTRAILDSIYELLSKTQNEKDKFRTIYIDSKKVNPMQFNITLSQKKKLIKSGEKAANAYFAWFNNPAKERVIV